MKGFGVDILGAAFNRHASISKQEREELEKKAANMESHPDLASE
jgi:hypothetical protein